jgi:hypothetical protein
VNRKSKQEEKSLTAKTKKSVNDVKQLEILMIDGKLMNSQNNSCLKSIFTLNLGIVCEGIKLFI